MDLTNVGGTASLRYAWTTPSFPPDLGLTIMSRAQRGCSIAGQNKPVVFCEDFRMDV
jgi:hypothetical protein